MAEIADWIKKIIALLILAGFLEMILPDNQLKGVTKLVMGLLVLLVVSQPMLKILKIPPAVLEALPTVSEVTKGGEDPVSTRKILSEGLKIRGFWTKDLRERTRKIIEAKIQDSIGLLDDIQLVHLNTELQDENINGMSGISGYTFLKRVALRVRINHQKKERFAYKDTVIKRKEYNRRIRETIRLITNLPDHLIEVTWDD